MTGGALVADVVVERRGFALRADVTAEPGEIIAVMGPSGAGKSTLLSAIAGLVRLSGGHVRIGDRDVASTKPRFHLRPALRGAVLLGQEPRLFPHLTARENVAFGPRARGIARKVALGEADDWLWRVGLPGSGEHKPAELSGGQQQRVAVARALATAPQLLLLDEPLTALDPATAGDVRAMLHEQLTSTRSTALIVTHDAVDAAALATRLVVVEGGAVSQEGEVADVLARPATPFIATVSGLNRIEGVAHRGAWWARGVTPEVLIETADASSRSAAQSEGAPLAAVFRPSAVRLERAPESSWTGALRLAETEESTPGTWLGRVVRIERTPIGARVHTLAPAVAVDMPADAVATLGLAPGQPVRLRVDPRDVRLLPSPAGPAAPTTGTTPSGTTPPATDAPVGDPAAVDAQGNTRGS